VRENEERFRSLTELSSEMYWEQTSVPLHVDGGTGSQRVNVKTLSGDRQETVEQNYVNMTADAGPAYRAARGAQAIPRHELCRLDETGNKIWISISGERGHSLGSGYPRVGKDISGAQAGRGTHSSFSPTTTPSYFPPNRAMFTMVLKLAIQECAPLYTAILGAVHRPGPLQEHQATRSATTPATSCCRNGDAAHQTMRASDVWRGLGGDEFVVLVQEVPSRKQVAAVARKVLSALVQPMSIQGQNAA